jgi:hypothetical protein
MKLIILLALFSIGLAVPAWADFTVATSQKLNAKVDVIGKDDNWCDTSLSIKFTQTDGSSLSVETYDELLPKVQSLINSQCVQLASARLINGNQQQAYTILSGNWVLEQPAPVITTPKQTPQENQPAKVANNSLAESENKPSTYPTWLFSLIAVFGALTGIFYLINRFGQSFIRQRGLVLLAMLVSFIPTYILPYYGSNSSLLNAAALALVGNLLITFWLHLFVYGFATLLMWFSHRGISKLWVIAPVFAAILDLTPGLSSLPFLPTLLMVISLVGAYLNTIATLPIAVSPPTVDTSSVMQANDLTNMQVMMPTESQNNMPSIDNTKPIGIVLITILNGLGGVLFSILGFVGFMAGTTNQQVDALASGLFLSVFGIVFILLAYGLWQYQLWSYRFTKVAYIISIPLSLILVITNFSTANVIGQVISIALCVWAIHYLSQPHIRDLFRQ